MKRNANHQKTPGDIGSIASEKQDRTGVGGVGNRGKGVREDSGKNLYFVLYTFLHLNYFLYVDGYTL